MGGGNIPQGIVPGRPRAAGQDTIRGVPWTPRRYPQSTGIQRQTPSAAHGAGKSDRREFPSDKTRPTLTSPFFGGIITSKLNDSILNI